MILVARKVSVEEVKRQRFLKKQEALAKVNEYAGRRKGSIAGSHIDSLIALRKAIVLCWKCRKKFNAKAAHYHKPRNIPFVRASRCDDCRELPPQAELFVHEEMTYL